MENPNGQYIKTSNGYIYIAPGIKLREVEPIEPSTPVEPTTGPLTEREAEWIAHNIWNGGIEGWIQ